VNIDDFMGKIILLTACMLLPAFSFSETVYLKNGAVLKGSVTENGDSAVNILTPNGSLGVNRFSFWFPDKKTVLVMPL